MKKEEIFEMTKHINEEYILEAAPVTKKNIKLKKRIITFGIAAAIAASLSIGAVATYKALNRDSVGKHYDSSMMDQIEQKGYVYNQESENEHFKFTIETALKDDWGVVSVITIKPLSEDAQNYMKQSANAGIMDPSILTQLIYSDKEEKISNKSYRFDLSISERNRTANGDYSAYLTIPYKKEDVTLDPARPIRIEFEKDPETNPDASDDLFKGLSLDIKDFKESKNVKLYTDNDTTMNISEFSLLVSGFDNETFLKERENMDTDESIVYFKDGTSMKVFDLGTFVMGYDQQNKMQESTLFYKLIDPDNIDHVFYAGHDYKRK